MTSRLKRKLNDLGVDPSSSKANESFCLIGTPLPPLEKSKDTGEFVPLWKQDVRDEQGRRRLHGAFTGGFSAGYFNTVGSKEGWTPSTFVSSRNDRAKKNKARPEDFMDEEDLAELRESRKLVDENDEMDFGGTEAELQKRAGENPEDDSIANALAASLAPPAQDSAGARILKKMGWRLGQGIGPRITYDQRRAQDRAYGYAVVEEDEEAKKHMYPRRDTPLLVVPRKDNSHGLGYSPGMSLTDSIGRGGAKEATGPKLASGFGLGALNDADEDDLDVYDGNLGSGNSRRMLAYDAGDDDDEIVMGSSKRRDAATGTLTRPISTQTFRDGRPVLKGFVLSDQPVAEERWFPLPEVPSGWKPNPMRVWEAEANKENRTVSLKGKEREVPRSHEEWKRNALSADERGNLLGETPLPAQARSVFDFLSQKDKERLERIRSNLTSGGPPSDPRFEPEPSMPPPQQPQRGELNIPHIHPSVAKAALQGFQPFRADPVKQSRYMAFLAYASQDASVSTQLGVGPLPDQTIDDFNKELADYAKSAAVFKPLSGAMANRFKSAAIVEVGPQVIEGLHTPVQAPEEQGAQKDEPEEDPRMAAVRAGMYGLLTREVSPWQPARLLCRRFGVKEPEVDTGEVEPPSSKFSASAGAAPGEGTGTAGGPPLAITDGSVAGDVAAASTGAERTGPRNLANIGLGDDEDQGRDTLTYERPAMDVFKAIFASDDEDSDGDEDEPEQAPSNVVAPPAKDTATPAHLTAREPTRASYEPPASDAMTAEGKVDMASFKPTFVPRDSRKEKERDKDKDKKKKKKAKTLVSFDAEDEGLQISVKKSKDKNKDGERKKKKRREEKGQPPEDDDSMWVEKPAPEIVQTLPMDVDEPVAPPSHSIPSIPEPPRGRKRAIDFM